MYTITKTLKITFLLLFLAFTTFSFAQSSARYTVTFTGLWNSMDHGMLPDNDHWSPLVGTTHNSNVTFWEVGQLASAGIEDVAEIGDSDKLFIDINNAITNGDAINLLEEGFSPNEALGTSIIMDVIVSEDLPLLTLVSMIAPSPDWFVGINSFSFLDGSNNWKTSIPPIDMFPYDAGTEEGTGYSTDNAATMMPGHIPIFSRVNMTPFNDQPVGTLTITFEELLGIEDESFQNGIRISPNPASDVIRISNNSTSALNAIHIYDIVGNLVQKIDSNLSENTLIIQRNALESGLYLVNIISEEGQSVTKKLILN